MFGERHEDLRDVCVMMWLCLVLAALVALATLTAAFARTPIAILERTQPRMEVT
jgi:hypothetical protein